MICRFRFPNLNSKIDRKPFQLIYPPGASLRGQVSRRASVWLGSFICFSALLPSPDHANSLFTWPLKPGWLSSISALRRMLFLPDSCEPLKIDLILVSYCYSTNISHTFCVCEQKWVLGLLLKSSVFCFQGAPRVNTWTQSDTVPLVCSSISTTFLSVIFSFALEY